VRPNHLLPALALDTATHEHKLAEFVVPTHYRSKAFYAHVGKNFVRNDSETPEDVAAGNIAKAQQSSGNAIDSIKCGLLV
jgi:hypothetical protein